MCRKKPTKYQRKRCSWGKESAGLRWVVTLRELSKIVRTDVANTHAHACLTGASISVRGFDVGKKDFVSLPSSPKYEPGCPNVP